MKHSIQDNAFAGEIIAKQAAQGITDIFTFEALTNWDWKTWEFQIKINLSLRCVGQLDNKNEIDNKINGNSGQLFILGLSLPHLVILLRQDEILKCLLNVEPSIDIWKEQVIVEFNLKSYELDPKMHFKGDDAWILQANSLHLAARFHPHALQYLLALANKDELIKTTHNTNVPINPYRFTTPLHVAASQPDCTALRYTNNTRIECNISI